MKYIKSLDRFAPKVELNLEGSTYQKSTFGGLVSLCSYLVVFAYGITLLNKLVTKSDPSITTFDVVTDLRKVGNVTASDVNFNLAI